MVKVNGTEYDMAGKTVSECLNEQNYNPAKVAVELNGSIVARSRYEKTILEDGCHIEIVSFVGGG